jgi:hypothetical protein
MKLNPFSFVSLYEADPKATLWGSRQQEKRGMGGERNKLTLEAQFYQI